MQLTQFTDFGLRTLLYLAGAPEGELITIKEIATQFNLQQNHLNKIVGRLSKLGWVTATPGRNGGLRLAVAPKNLLLGDVIKTLEGHMSLVDCNKLSCNLRGNCHLQRVLAIGINDFYQGMNQHSLADLILPPTANVIAKMFANRPIS